MVFFGNSIFKKLITREKKMNKRGILISSIATAAVVAVVLVVAFSPSASVQVLGIGDVSYYPPPNASPIYIDENSDITSTYPYLGSPAGTSWSTAYVIENLVIYAVSGDLIYIYNTNVYLIIRNCILLGGTDGIDIDSCSHIKIENCTIVGVTNQGIEISDSTDIFALKSTIVGNRTMDDGFRIFDYSENITISNNYVVEEFENNMQGVDMDDCSDILISNNIFSINSSSSLYSIIDIDICDHITVDNNDITMNRGDNGIYANAVDFCIFTNNEIIGNGNDVGICIEDWSSGSDPAVFNDISHNVVKNFAYGISTYYSALTNVTNNYVNYSVFGIWSAHDTYLQILNNNISYALQCGIFMQYADPFTIGFGNRIDGNRITECLYGIYSEYDPLNGDSYICNNILDNGYETGIWIYSCGSMSGYMQINGNEITDFGDDSGDCGILIDYSGYMNITNNEMQNVNDYGLVLSNSAFIIVQNMTIKNANSAALQVYNSGFMILDQLNIDKSMYGIKASGSGIWIPLSNATIINVDNGIYLEGSGMINIVKTKISAQHLGIYADSTSSSVIVDQCQVDVLGSYGIQVYCSDFSIMNSTITLPADPYDDSSSDDIGIYCYGSMVTNLEKIFIYNNTITGGDIAIQLIYVKKSNIQLNTLTSDYGIYFSSVSTTNITQNTIKSLTGIYNYYGNGIIMKNNSITFRTSGIALIYNNWNTIINQNTIIYDNTIGSSNRYNYLNFGAGILVYRNQGTSITNNVFLLSSIVFPVDPYYSTTYDCISHGDMVITGNTVNGKNIYAFWHASNKDMDDYPNFGELLLFDCTDFKIEEYAVSEGSCAIYMQYSSDVKIRGITMTDFTRQGITAYKSDMIIMNNLEFNNVAHAITMSICSNYNITNSDFNSNNMYQLQEFDFLAYDWNILNLYCENFIICGNDIYKGILGISALQSFNGTIQGNEIKEVMSGIVSFYSEKITINSNILSSTSWYVNPIDFKFGNSGIKILESDNIAIDGNTITKFAKGIEIKQFNSRVSITNNIMVDSGIIFIPDFNPDNYEWDDGYKDFFNITITGNTVNEKPIYFIMDTDGLTNADVANAGQILLVNCNNFEFSDFLFEDVSVAIFMYHCSGGLITKNTFRGNFINLDFRGSFGNKIYLNHFEGSPTGSIATIMNLDANAEFGMVNQFYDEVKKVGNYYWDYEIRYPSATNDGRVWNIPYNIRGLFHEYYNYNILYYIPTVDLYPLVGSPTQTLPMEILWWEMLLIIMGSVSGGVVGLYLIQTFMKRKGSNIAMKSLKGITNRNDCKLANGTWKNGKCI